MLDHLNDALTAVQESRPLLIAALVLVFGLGIIICMIVGLVRDWFVDRREERWEREAKEEYDRISHGWNEENSDEWSLTNETYHAAAQQRTLFSDWRERVARAAEPVMENYTPRQNFMQEQATARWPEWTPEQLMQPGRHRFDNTVIIEAMPVSPGQGYTPRQLRALVEDTGAFSAVRIEPKELAGVGNR